jgi:hypothetical protein
MEDQNARNAKYVAIDVHESQFNQSHSSFSSSMRENSLHSNSATSFSESLVLFDPSEPKLSSLQSLPSSEEEPLYIWLSLWMLLKLLFSVLLKLSESRLTVLTGEKIFRFFFRISCSSLGDLSRLISACEASSSSSFFPKMLKRRGDACLEKDRGSSCSWLVGLLAASQDDPRFDFRLGVLAGDGVTGGRPALETPPGCNGGIALGENMWPKLFRGISLIGVEGTVSLEASTS